MSEATTVAQVSVFIIVVLVLPYYYILAFNFIMSLHELNRNSKGKVDHKEMNNTRAAGQSSAPKNDLFELVWEHGQVSMQGQSSSSIAKKNPTFKSLPYHSPKGQEKDSGYVNETNTRMGKFEDLDTGLNEITRPAGEVDLCQEEDVMMPWLNYGMDDSLQHEYSSGFLHELSGVTMNELPASYKFSLLDKRGSSNCNQVFRDSNKHYPLHFLSSEQGFLSKGCCSSAAAEEVDTCGPKDSTSQLYTPLLLHQCQPSFASIRSRESDIAENNTSNATQHTPCGEISQIPHASSGFRQDPNMSSNSSTIMNFTHFAKPAAIVKSNLQNIGVTSGLSCSRLEKVGIKKKNKGEAATGSNPPESTKVHLSGECPKKAVIHSEQAMEPTKVDLKPLEPKSLEQDDAVSTPACKEDVSKVDQTSNQVISESGRKGQEAVEKCIEPAVVSSSVCSGNFVERDSDDPNKNLKRKGRDIEDSECNSEDVEDESVGVKRAAHARGGMGSKRHRSAEVHNLSERRRRDRINEKMRELQELIPNCNKVDKASMLDEAIEYLKALQLQLQIMSMGGGLYMPRMMLPAGMQHMHAAHMSPFSPMGIGMQMGLGVGYGMGMPDVNDGSSRFPMPQLRGTHLPVAHTSGPAAALHGMARSNPQMFGLPSQGIPMHMPCAPMFSFPGLGESLMNPSAAGLNGCGTAGVMEAMESASAPKLKDPIPNVNSQVMQNNNGCNPTNHMSTQCEAATVEFEQSTLVLDSDHASLGHDRGAVNVNPGKEESLVIDKSHES